MPGDNSQGVPSTAWCKLNGRFVKAASCSPNMRLACKGLWVCEWLYAVNSSIVVYRILKVYSLSCAKETQRPTPERDSFVGLDMFRFFSDSTTEMPCLPSWNQSSIPVYVSCDCSSPALWLRSASLPVLAESEKQIEEFCVSQLPCWEYSYPQCPKTI